MHAAAAADRRYSSIFSRTAWTIRRSITGIRTTVFSNDGDASCANAGIIAANVASRQGKDLLTDTLFYFSELKSSTTAAAAAAAAAAATSFTTPRTTSGFLLSKAR